MQTSITLAAVNKFLKTAKPQDAIYCSHIPGLRLIKTVNGATYRYRYTAADGRRRDKAIGKASVLKPQQAAEIAARWRSEGIDPLREDEQRKSSIKDAIESEKLRRLGDYIDGPYARHQARKKSGSSTLNMLKSSFPDLLPLDMSTISKQHVVLWQQKQEKKGLSHATIKRSYGALKTLLNHASAQDVIDANPIIKINLQPPAFSEKERDLVSRSVESRRQLTNEEVSKFVRGVQLFEKEKPGHWFAPFALLALHTGLRPGDLLSLTWQELNINFKKLVKVPEKTRHHSSPSKIVMDLTDQAIEDIKPWWLMNGKPESGLVFPSPKTGRKIVKGGYRKAWVKLKQLSGLADDLDFYALRHDFISRLVAAGVPMLTVARLAGHKSAKMIESHYGHLCPESANNALRALEQSRRPEASNKMQ